MSRDIAWLVDAITSCVASNAVNFDSVFKYLFYLRVIVSGVTSTIDWLLIGENRGNGISGNQSDEFFEASLLPQYAVGTGQSGCKGGRVAMHVKVQGRWRRTLVTCRCSIWGIVSD